MLIKSIFLLLGLICQSKLARREDNFKLNVILGRSVKSLGRVLSFYVDNFDKVNLDSIFGLRVAEGSLVNILTEISENHSHFQKLTFLHAMTKNAAEKALPYLKDYQPEYYNQFKPVVDKQWKIFQNFRKIREKVQRKNLSHFENEFDEKVSDQCMTEILGTSPTSKHPCHISLSCFKLMTSDYQRRYGSTHQVLYFLLAFQTGCRQVVEKNFQKFRGYLNKTDILSVDEFLEEKCEQILEEMTEQTKYVMTNGHTDLFMEQGLVCGILGFENFLDISILKSIFHWQDAENGCFGKENSHNKVKLL